MIIYNVTVKVENNVADQWRKWMLEEHIPDLMQTKLFVDARLCKLLEQDELDGITYSAQYFCNSIAEYNKYISLFAQEMREKAAEKFGGKFVAFRTLLEVIN